MWVKNKIQQRPINSQHPKTYQHGQILKVGDEEYLLNISYHDKKSSKSFLKENQISIILSKAISEEKQHEHISQLLSKTIAVKKYPFIQEKLHSLNKNYFQQPIHSISLKNTSSKWGSCSSEGKICLSTRLLFAPEKVIDYVCIHELSHLIEPNHSSKFWNIVEKIVPDYKDQKRWLKVHGELCRF